MSEFFHDSNSMAEDSDEFNKKKKSKMMQFIQQKSSQASDLITGKNR